MVMNSIPSVPALMKERKLTLEEAVELHLTMITMEALNTLYEGSIALAVPVPKRERAIYVDKMNPKDGDQLAKILDAEATLRDIFAEKDETIISEADNMPVPLFKSTVTEDEIKSGPKANGGVVTAGCGSPSLPSVDMLAPMSNAHVPQIRFVRRKPVPKYEESSPRNRPSSFNPCPMGCEQYSSTCAERRNSTIPKPRRRQPLSISPGSRLSNGTSDSYASTTSETVSLGDFSLKHYLGGGSQGSVYLAKHKNNNNILYAVKTIEKETLDASDVVRARREQKVLKKIRGNPFVLELLVSFEDTRYLYLVTPFYGGRDLQEVLFHHQRFTLQSTRFYSAEIILGLEYIHTLGLFHRDIKLSNILLTNDGHIILADFGLVEEVSTSQKTFCGTVTFMAPEVMECKPYGPESDIWSLGMAIWAMRTGLLPWFEEEDDEYLTQTKLGIVNDPLPERDPEMESELYDVCFQILNKDPLKRPTCSALREHPMFLGVDWTVLEKREQEGPWIPDSIDGVILGLGSLTDRHAFEPGSPVDGESECQSYQFTAPDFPPPIDGSLPPAFMAFLATRPSTTSYLFSQASSTQDFGGSEVIGDGQLSSSSSHSPANSSGDVAPYANSETSSFIPAPTPAMGFLFDSQGSHCWIPHNRPAEPSALSSTYSSTRDASYTADTPAVQDPPLREAQVVDPPPDLETINLAEDSELDTQPLSEADLEDASPSCEPELGTMCSATSSRRLPRLFRWVLQTGKKLLAYLQPQH